MVICSVVPGERQITIVCHEKLYKNRLQKVDFQYEEIIILNRNEDREMKNITLAIKPQIPELEVIPEK